MRLLSDFSIGFLVDGRKLDNAEACQNYLQCKPREIKNYILTGAGMTLAA